MNEPAKSNKTLIIVLVIVIGGAGLCCFGGILASIAIPAFQRATKKSKAAEAELKIKQAENGLRQYWDKHCAMPPKIRDSARVPRGGQKVRSDMNALAEWQKYFQVALPLTSYFSYQTKLSPARDEYTITAKADFVKGGPSHALSITAVGTKKGCTLVIQPSVTINHLE